MPASSAAMWLTIAGVGILDAFWMWATGFGVVPASLLKAAAILSPLVVIALFYHATGRSRRLAALAHSLAITFAFFAVAGVLSYLAAASGNPLIDEPLARIDQALGLDWPAWFAWVEASPILNKALYLIYGTSGVMLLFCLAFLPLTGRYRANRELVWSVMIALIITIPLSGWLPAESAWVYYGVQERVDAYHMAHFSALRAGQLRELDLAEMTGLITFPSFHTALAILVAYSVRECRPAFVSLGALNLLVVVSVPTAGGHHFIDVIAGAAVALVAIALARCLKQLLDLLDARRARGVATAAVVAGMG